MVSLEMMLGSSVHLGHQVQQWNPKMSPYIYGERNGVHIIDLLQTLVCLEKVSKFLSLASRKNKTFFVSTKRQFTSIIESCALNSNSYYVTQRWLGGMLTNWSTIKLCIDSLRSLIKQESDGSLLRMSKKESLILKKRKDRLEKYLSGIKDMPGIPDVVILVGQLRELNAVRECIKLGIPLITILDTNCDPTLTDFLVPANDDSVASVSLILNEFSKAISK
uniref:Small ribosomal subunit protein uS2c n=1 Tax=Monomorphina parapyrum TaxID=1664066 RepID=A0A0G3VGD0_9EUGL|nr:ribosomal protein S2 [Monomorphina parapyrum]AKL78942.1 ribosomal protein S2 [Monomorphina parapyrum]